jgi:adenine-specific DNA-methyltransferase
LEDLFQELVADGRIWFVEDGSNVPRLKCFRTESTDGVTPHTLWQASEVGTTDSAKKAIIQMFDGQEVFDTPKPVGLLQRILQIGGGCESGDVFMDFFAGSGAFAEACLRENLADGKRRRFVLVQLAEPVPEDSGARKAGYKTIAEVAKDRIRRAANLLEQESGHALAEIDRGFRVLRIDTTNRRDVHHSPEALRQIDLVAQTDNFEEGRTPEDLLFQVLIDWGIDLSKPIDHQVLDGCHVFFVDSNALVACFDREIREELVKDLARSKPLRAVFRDSSYADDSAKLNVEQIFKLLSPETEVRTL